MEKVPSPVPESFTDRGGAGIETKMETEEDKFLKLHWSEFYEISELKNLIKEGLVHNRELRVAALNIKELMEFYQIQKSPLYPNVNVNGTYSKRRIPENAILSQGGAVGFPAPRGFTQEQYGIEVGITNYEIDLFGRLRSLRESALNDYLASRAASDSVVIVLVSEIAEGYLQYLANKSRMKVAQRTVKSQEETVRIIRSRNKTGVASKLEVKQAQTLLESARADIHLYEREMIVTKNSLELLVGRPIKDSELTLSFSDVYSGMKTLPVNLNSRMLLRRPDIRQAERQLLSDNANIGAARAAFFPRVSLSTGYGRLSTETSNLFDNESTTWNFVPQVSLPIFTGGRNTAQLKVAKLRKKKSIARYERAIQVAFKEVSDALISNEKFSEVLKTRKDLMDTSREAYDLSRLRYLEGVDNYLIELDSRRSLYLAELGLIEGQLQYLSNLSYLYRSLGGGF